jgi:hypothetical protein
MVMRKSLAHLRRLASCFSRPLVLGAFLVAAPDAAFAECCSDAVAAPPVFVCCGPGAGASQIVTVGKETLQQAIARAGVNGEVRIPANYRSPEGGEPNLEIAWPVSLVAQVPGTAWFKPKDSGKPCISVSLRRFGTVRIQGLVVRGNDVTGAACVFVAAPQVRSRGVAMVGTQEFVLRESTVIGAPSSNAVEVRGGTATIERSYIAHSKTAILLFDRLPGMHSVSNNDLENNARGLVVVHSDATAQANLIHGNTEYGILTVDGGGTYGSNLIYRNGTGVKLIYGEGMTEDFTSSIGSSTSVSSASESAPYSAGVSPADSQLYSSQSPYQNQYQGQYPYQYQSQYQYPSAYAGTAGMYGYFGMPYFQKNVIARNSQTGVTALGNPFYSLASFSGDCIYDNATDIVGRRLIYLVNRERNRNRCNARGSALAEAARITMESVVTWIEHSSELGVTRPTLGTDWSGIDP